MTLNPSTMRLGIASILVGLVGAYGVRHMMEEEEVPEEEKQEVVFDMPISTGDLPIGRVIRRGDVAFRPMTSSKMDDESLNRNELMMAPEQIIGRKLRRGVKLGSPFYLSDVHLEGGGDDYVVKPGMRAVPIRVTEDRGGANVDPGNTVDLYFTSTPQKGRDGKPDIPEKTMQVAEGIQILHIEWPALDELRWAVGYKAKAPIFTVEVDPETAGKITTLKDYGDFAVLVRSADEPLGRAKGDGEYSVLDLLGIEE